MSVLTSAFASLGHEIEIDCASPADLMPTLERAFATDPDAVIIGGGDGSVRAAVPLALQSGIAIGVVPLGTHNRLARDLNVPSDINEAGFALAAAAQRVMDVGYVNNNLFLCTSLIGLPPKYTRARQRARGRPLRERIASYVAALLQVLAATKRLRVTLNDGSKVHRFRALSVAVANNPYDETTPFQFKRARLDGGDLAVYVSQHQSGWAMVRAGVRALLGQWSGDPQVLKLTATAFTLSVNRASLTISNDGEVESLSTPLRYTIKRKALKILVPVPTDV